MTYRLVEYHPADDSPYAGVIPVRGWVVRPHSGHRCRGGQRGAGRDGDQKTLHPAPGRWRGGQRFLHGTRGNVVARSGERTGLAGAGPGPLRPHRGGEAVAGVPALTLHRAGSPGQRRADLRQPADYPAWLRIAAEVLRGAAGQTGESGGETRDGGGLDADGLSQNDRPCERLSKNPALIVQHLEYPT